MKHCVNCGLELTPANEKGLICLACAELLKPNPRLPARQILTINYCFDCGQPLVAAGAAITHERCEN